MGVIATAITVLAYVLDPDQASVFWTLFALSSIVFLIPYLLMFPALLVLRRKFPDQHRPYVVPGGTAGAWMSTILCEAGIILTVFLFFYYPVDGTSKGVFWAITGGGTAIVAADRLAGSTGTPGAGRGVSRDGRCEEDDGSYDAARRPRRWSSPWAATPSCSPARWAPSRSSSSTSTRAMRRIAQLVEDGWRVVLTHGNGPQVGNLLIQNALAAKTVAPMPMDVCGAMSQGQIGYMLEQTLQNHLRKRKLDVTVVTRPHAGRGRPPRTRPSPSPPSRSAPSTPRPRPRP